MRGIELPIRVSTHVARTPGAVECGARHTCNTGCITDTQLGHTPASLGVPAVFPLGDQAGQEHLKARQGRGDVRVDLRLLT